MQGDHGKMNLKNRVEKLLCLMESKSLDCLLITNAKNMEYLTSFEGGSLLLISRNGENMLFVYGVNYEAARAKAKGVLVKLVKHGEILVDETAEMLKAWKIHRLGFDSLTVSTYLKLKERLDNVEFKDASNVMWSLRKIKDSDEISLMKKAAELTSLGMQKALEIVEAGISEREVAAEIEYAMRKKGSDGVSFDTIVSSGLNSAYPHGGCGDRVMKEGDFVVVDVGAKYRSYCSDMTRTFIIGKPSPKQLKIYETVRKAQMLAAENVRAGVEAREIDHIARDFISRAGYGEYFVHGLGHGVGLDIHEPPTLNPYSKDVLSEGNVLTIEPGIYIPGFGGVRIEDTVLVLDSGVEKLTDAPYIYQV